MKKSGFTLIELLVVIVIIGILATLATVTFSSSQKKARDTQRQAFVRNGQQILLGSQTNGGMADYRLGGDSASSITTAFKNELAKQGYAIPITQNSIGFYLFLETTDITATDAERFMLFSCQEDELGSAVGAANDIGFLSGNADWSDPITDVNARLACAENPSDPSVNAGWVCINLSTEAECS